MDINPLGLDPTLLKLGPLEIRWYGLMYVLGYVVGGKLLKHLIEIKFSKFTVKDVDTYVTMLIIGMFLGARLAFVFIYNWDYYQDHLSSILSVWEGGLSFHGAVFGMCVATFLFAKKRGLHFFEVSDAMAIAGSPGLLFGRLGNFINGELYGRVTDSGWGMLFSKGGPYPRHASQLYEGFLEGVILFAFLYMLGKRAKIYGIVSTFFLLGYGIFRFSVEFFREPDSQLGYYFNGQFTMGQILCFLMILGSGLCFLLAKKANLKILR